ncbi:MAG: hypothetical protein AAB965_03160 [Patescibacteria group bacterium]
MNRFRLQGNDRIVTIQFRLSNPNMIPRLAKLVPESSVDTERDLAYSSLNPTNGELVLASVPSVDVSNLLSGLVREYTLTNLVRRRVQNGYKGNTPNWVYTIKYVFTQGHIAVPKDAVKGNQLAHCLELQTLLEESFWATMAHRNPFIANGRSVPGTTAISFSLAARVPKELRWQRDPNTGEKIGETKVPMKPEAILKVSADGVVSMEMTASETASAQA